LEKNDSLQLAELGSRDAAAVAGNGTPVRKSIGEMLNQNAGFVRRRVFHSYGLLPQERVAELQDGADWHGDFPVLS
jgi:hypothetical protein